jgi:hypothetical protein
VGPNSGSSQGRIDPSVLGPPGLPSGLEDITRSEAERMANPVPGGGPAGGSEAAGAFAKGVVLGAATSVATTAVLTGISAVCPVCGAAIGIALLAKTIYELANGGLSQTIESTGRIFSGEGTSEDYYAAGALLGSIAGGKAMGLRGAGARAPSGALGGGGGSTLAGGGGGGIPRKITNPFGRPGSPAHRARILQAEQRLNAMGFKTVSGGSLPEAAVNVGGGKIRFPDLTVRNAQGKTVGVNVGRATKGGKPVWRERAPLKDLRNSGQFDHMFFLKY